MKSLYVPYKAVGYVADDVPFVINDLGGELFLSVSIGKAFQVYRLDKLQVCLVSRQIDGNGKISSLQVLGHDTFVSIDNKIYVYNRAEIKRIYDEHEYMIINMIIIRYTIHLPL